MQAHNLAKDALLHASYSRESIARSLNNDAMLNVLLSYSPWRRVFVGEDLGFIGRLASPSPRPMSVHVIVVVNHVSI